MKSEDSWYQTPVHHTKNPEQNGVAERLNCTLVESVRTMLTEANLPQCFWAEALATAVYLKNRSPTVSISNTTPHESYMGRNHLSIISRFWVVLPIHIFRRKSKRSWTSKLSVVFYLDMKQTSSLQSSSSEDVI
uniref:Integrase catalytic domain-containing protein n=1 Tax=Amphimedon queenslandica TaxID=400682 RepID=A0A1X7VD77_AMPQE